MAGSWVNVVPGVPVIGNFGSTSGQGTPICINAADGAAYYCNKGVVYRVGLGDGGGSGGGGAAPPADPEALWESMKALGEMRKAGPDPITLGAGWTDIVLYDTTPVTFVRCGFDLSNGSIGVPFAGTYLLTFTLSLTFNPVNAGTQFGVRLFNKTISAASSGTTMYVGRDAEGYTLSLSAMVDAQGSSSIYVMQVGGGDTFANAQVQEALFGLARVG
jgi:hypothetical protein